MQILKIIVLLLIVYTPAALNAQEHIAPLQENVLLKGKGPLDKRVGLRPTLLTLPFFEDFTDNSAFPSPERWADFNVFVNNTMGFNPVSRGVATFDALNSIGMPYDTISAYSQVFADTLTSLAVDLSGNTPADSVYLSFFYQPKGYGFSPKPADSLMLYLLKSNGVWEEVWARGGDTLRPFQQVMIAVTDTGYFNANFRFRWINRATKGVSDSHWNLDYIRLDEGRTINDVSLNDIAFTRQPESILNDFTAMPMRQFRTNPNSFLNTTQNVFLRNNGNNTASTTVGYRARATMPATALGNGTANVNLPANTNQPATFAMYNAAAFNPANPNGSYILEHTYYANSIYTNESKTNDTIVTQQVFDNYFAYDDGTAEQSYFLNLLPSAPGITAVEYALYAPDTLRGIAIRFARQVPSARQKEFSIVVYRDIAVNGGQDVEVYREDFLFPNYEDTLNKFSVYKFEEPQFLNSGVFYVGIVQPAGGTSDSLHIALDANRVGGNHRYYKVESAWEASLLDGALLLRPLVGSELPLAVKDTKFPEIGWSIVPNPANDYITLNVEKYTSALQYSIYNVEGKMLLQGSTRNNKAIDIAPLPRGVYFVHIRDGEKWLAKPKKIVKR